MRLTNEMLKQAAEDVSEICLRDFMDVADLPEPEYSPEFHKKMAALMDSIGKRRPRKHTAYYLKRTAAIVLVAVVGAFGCLMSVKACREAIMNKVVEIYRELTQFQYFVPADDPEYFEELPEVEFGYIPDGMTLVRDSRSEDRISIEYRTPEGKYFRLLMNLIAPDSAFSEIVDSENAQIDEIQVWGYPATMYQKNGFVLIRGERRNIVWKIMGTYGKEAIIKILENILMKTEK